MKCHYDNHKRLTIPNASDYFGIIQYAWISNYGICTEMKLLRRNTAEMETNGLSHVIPAPSILTVWLEPFVDVLIVIPDGSPLICKHSFGISLKHMFIWQFHINV